MDETSAGAENSLAVPIEAHGERVVEWRQSQRGGSREDRMLRHTTVSLPPKIADFSPKIPSSIAMRTDSALTAITQLDSSYGHHLASLSSLLLRAESVASSKIEHIEASLEDFAKASHGEKSNASATSMVASAKALNSLITSVDDGCPISLSNILTAHRTLMADDTSEARYAGRLRDMQNWIGGSDYSPRNAMYVPPPPVTVKDYLDDLLEFANRDDVPALAQAAVAHAQFESIHPFTDGNGRIGRALINTILRRRGVTTKVVVPLASALVAKKEAYFDVLSAYREGDAGPIIRAFSQAARTSARESVASAQRLAELPQLWIDMYRGVSGKSPRAGSAASEILDVLRTMPFFTREDVEDVLGGATSSIYSAIEKLAEAGILRALTDRKRRQIWCAGAVIDELEDLGHRIASQTVTDPDWQTIHRQVIDEIQRQTHERWTKTNGILAEVARSDVMRNALSGPPLSAEAQARISESLRLPDAVRANLDSFLISQNLRNILAPTAVSESTRQYRDPSVDISEPLQKPFSDLGSRLTRQTRLPEAVAQILRASDSQENPRSSRAEGNGVMHTDDGGTTADQNDEGTADSRCDEHG
ncbi:Fic family protein [Kocuria massiliensis]|uniref:Fic family protein n=1 Tax=Kocuria massiliensis TaxID=1926282 RepID=UPI0022B9B6F2|nr:Fic family protein [Kocuria massiliensis]